MNTMHILYEANLTQTGGSLQKGARVLLVLGFIGLVLCFVFGSFPEDIGPLLVIALFVALMASAFLKVSRLRRNPGVYRIFIDAQGLHVQSDDPILGPSFSISTTDLNHLVRKWNYAPDEPSSYTYYIEEKSGRRYLLSELLVRYNLDAMALFHRITEQFPSVTIVDEKVRS